MAAVEAELRLRGRAAYRRFGAVPALASVYLGGGTPSLLSARQVAALLETVRAQFGIAHGAEITLEVNPGPADRGDLTGFRAAGVNRLSVGAQSMDRGALRRLGRRHAPDDVRQTVREARQAGFDNLSVDLLYDVPGQTVRSWRRTVMEVLALGPQHVSAYALDLTGAGADGDHLPPKAGALRWRAKAKLEQNEDRAAACYEAADELLGAAGLHWYEVSNWALPGQQSRHNLAYWRWLPYEAVGPGAHSFDGARTRRWNAARLNAYLAALLQREAELPPQQFEALDRATAEAERAILALRTRTGLSARQARRTVFRSALGWGRSAGLLEASGSDRVRLTIRGRLLASELFWRLLPGSADEAA